MYNKSEIMKNAWSKFRSRNYATFAAALRQSWREAKRTAEIRSQGYVMVTELNVGDTIAVSGYGGYADNNFSTVITEIRTGIKFQGCKREYIVIHFGNPEHKNNICKQAGTIYPQITSKVYRIPILKIKIILFTGNI